MKTEWLVANVTVVGSIDRAERAIWGVFMTGRVFWPIQVILVVGEPLRGVGTRS